MFRSTALHETHHRYLAFLRDCMRCVGNHRLASAWIYDEALTAYWFANVEGCDDRLKLRFPIPLHPLVIQCAQFVDDEERKNPSRSSIISLLLVCPPRSILLMGRIMMHYCASFGARFGFTRGGPRSSACLCKPLPARVRQKSCGSALRGCRCPLQRSASSFSAHTVAPICTTRCALCCRLAGFAGWLMYTLRVLDRAQTTECLLDVECEGEGGRVWSGSKSKCL